MEHLELTEGSRFVAVPLSHAVASELAKLDVATIMPSSESGCFNLSNIRKVGAVVVDGTVIRIRPKTPVRRLFAMLGYSRRLNDVWREDDVLFDDERDLYSTMAQSFARALASALSGGVLRGYLSCDEALPLVRGRWRVTDQITRRAGQALPVEVSYDDFVEDIPENRIVMSAAMRILRFPEIRGATELSLRRSLRLLDGVTSLPSGAPLPTVRASRSNQRYSNALDLARLVLSNSSLEHREGSSLGSGFLVDVWTVFEDFVGAELVVALSAMGGVADLQHKDVLDHAARIAIAPDLVWSVDGGVAACIDLKYKIEHRGAYPNADLYQLVAYCTRYGLSVGHLIYASGDAEPRRIDILNGPTIYQHAVDLDLPHSELVAQVHALASVIASHVPVAEAVTAAP